MSTHTLKISTEYAQSLFNKKKTFEIRKNDRDYKVGDYLEFKGWEHAFTLNVTHILSHKDFPEGIKEGYVILSTRLLLPFAI